jgi:hypothetical protein
MQSTHRIKNELSSRDLARLNHKVIELENKLAKIEKKGARIKAIDLISMSFFATISSAIMVVSIVLLLLLKTKLI